MAHNIDSKKTWLDWQKMGSQEYIGPLIQEKMQLYTLTRAELLYTLCYEIPCTLMQNIMNDFRVNTGSVIANCKI